MVEELRIMESLQLRELGQILLYHSSVVLEEHVVEILGYKGAEACPGQGLVIEVEEEEGSCKAVQALPVHQARVVRHPGLEHTLQLPVTRGRGEQLVILVTPIKKLSSPGPKPLAPKTLKPKTKNQGA